MRMRMRMALCIAAAVAFAGCASSGTKVTADDLKQFQKGVTTEQEVVAKLGNPNATSISDGGVRIDIYSYAHVAANAANFIPIVGLAAGGAQAPLQLCRLRSTPMAS